MRWHRAVRNVVALNNMRPPPEPVPEEGDEGSEEEARPPRPGQHGDIPCSTSSSLMHCRYQQQHAGIC